MKMTSTNEENEYSSPIPYAALTSCIVHVKVHCDDIITRNQVSLVVSQPKEEIKEVSSPRKIRKKKKINKISLIINIVFTILIVIMLMITIDVISVARYNKGPFFAIQSTSSCYNIIYEI